jgi:hypothetical protein
MADEVLYRSACTARSLWHEYRVYPDRVELDSALGRWVVPLGQVEGVEVAEPITKAALHLRADLRDWPRQLKLDFADLCEHVTLDKSSGLIRHLFFTPDDPTGFVAAVRQALAAYRRSEGPAEPGAAPDPAGR